MERVVFFLDFANIERSTRDNGHQFDSKKLLDYMGEGRYLIDAYAYVPIDPRFEHEMDRKIEDLLLAGYFVNSKVGTIAGESYKCDFDVEMTLDILRIVNAAKPDIVVLATGDVDFLPVIKELRLMGVRVEVASFKSSVSRKMILHCSGFISLDAYHEELDNKPVTPQQEDNPDSDNDEN